jgi:hypothetical protein
MRMSDAVSGREFGTGPLSQAAAFIYTLLVVEVLFLVTTGPSLILLTFLDRDPSNIPLAALCLVPVGPALAAALYALQHRRSDLTDLKPAAAFWRGYLVNLRPALTAVVPPLAWLTIVAVSIVNLRAVGLPAWWGTVLVLVGLLTGLWAANALVIASLFSFRGRDVARLAGYFLVRRPAVTLGNACLSIAALGLELLYSEVALALLGAAFALGMLVNSRSMIAEIQREFTG